MRARLAPLLVLLGLLPLGSSCVVTYGGASSLRPEPLPAPNDLAEIEVRLETMIVGEIETDRRDRLVAAADLARLAALMAPAEQAQVRQYLQRVVAIEERSQPMSAPILFEEPLPEVMATFDPMGTVVEEEDLGGLQELSPGASPTIDAPPTAPPEARVLPPAAGSSSDPTELAHSALEAGDPGAALAALEPCVRDVCGEGAAELRARAEDAWIHQERERAGAIYLRARAEADPTERRLRLEEASTILSDLLARFPSAQHADAIARNLELVRKELAPSP